MKKKAEGIINKLNYQKKVLDKNNQILHKVQQQLAQHLNKNTIKPSLKSSNRHKE